MMISATTQHCADFARQVQALSGKTLADPVFFEQTVSNVQEVVLREGSVGQGSGPTGQQGPRI